MQHDVLRFDLFAVKTLVRVIVRAERGALQRYAGKQTARTRIRQHFRSQSHVCGGRSRSSHRPCSCRGIGAEFYFAAQDRACATLVHDKQHEVSSLSADLKPETAAFERHHRRRTPGTAKVVAGTAGHDAAAVACTHYKRRLENGRQDDHAIRFVDQILRNIIGDIHNLFRNFASVSDAVSFFCVVVRSAKRHWIYEGKQAYERCRNTKVPRSSHLTSSSGWAGLFESGPLFTARTISNGRGTAKIGISGIGI